jgi:hypothetical protein
MEYTKHTQKSRNIFSQQSFSPNGVQPLRGVGQDKGIPTFARTASTQPDPMKKDTRAHSLNKDRDRSQNTSKRKLRAVKATTWLNPLVKAELERKAALTGLSLSKVMAAALEEWVQQDIHRQYNALLHPMIRQVIREEFRSFGNRMVFFLMRIAFASEQSRILITNILDRILRREEAPEQTLTTLVDQSNKMARRNIIQKTPQIKSLLEEWENSFQDAREEGTLSNG